MSHTRILPAVGILALAAALTAPTLSWAAPAAKNAPAMAAAPRAGATAKALGGSIDKISYIGNCRVRVDTTLSGAGRAAVLVWDDSVRTGSYPIVTTAPGSQVTVHVLKQNVGTVVSGLGIYLVDEAGRELASADPWDFPGSADVMRNCQASGGAADKPKPSSGGLAKTGV